MLICIFVIADENEFRKHQASTLVRSYMSHIDKLNNKIANMVQHSEESTTTAVQPNLIRDLNDLVISTTNEEDNSNPWSSTWSSSTSPPPTRMNTVDLFEQEEPQPETQTRKWESDLDAKTCRVCVRKFGLLTRRRHHCRRCGLVVCDKCSPWKVFLNSSDILQDPEGPLESTTVLAAQQQRVCENCYFELQEQQ